MLTHVGIVVNNEPIRHLYTVCMLETLRRDRKKKNRALNKNPTKNLTLLMSML